MGDSYCSQHYGVPAEIGRRVVVDGRPGIIARDLGHHIGVTFDDQKPGTISPCHPTWRVEYGALGRIRPMTRAQERYRRFLDADGAMGTFADFLRHLATEPGAP